ncbi:25877_t:CDS:2 [Dentiscutata erythropus]|uniref:25877_t:CDS:1 n=1 Tax=Dentiscutata erythropus TaxID=1348616 RepID=A0A9N9HKB3_9GLOM|nr:25877_t:CDS:2 [Dentiscutata erythropus]
MPCYADTIVRIKYVSFHENKKINSLVVWALGAYPERDYKTQAVCEKDNFFCVGGKIVSGFYGSNKRAKMIVLISMHLAIFNKVSESNKCPLKVFLVGIPQEKPNEVKDDAIFKILESLVFVVGQLEIIENEFYVYAKAINYINMRFSSKKRYLDGDVSHDSVACKSSIRSKLLVTYQNIVGDSEEKTDDFNGSFDDGFVDIDNNYFSEGDNVLSDYNQDEVEKSSKDSVDKNRGSRNKGKGPVRRSLHSNLSLYGSGYGKV